MIIDKRKMKKIIKKITKNYIEKHRLPLPFNTPFYYSIIYFEILRYLPKNKHLRYVRTAIFKKYNYGKLTFNFNKK